MLIDLHTHTFPNSDDSFVSPDELVNAAKGLGLDGICITEHDYFWDPDDIRALSRKHDFLVLPGCEVNTDGGHVLVLGLEKYVFGMHRAAFLRKLVEQASGVMVVAHPYRRRYIRDGARKSDDYWAMVNNACQDEFFSLCDAIEVLNGRATNDETTFSHDLGRRLDLGAVGGSDSHRLAHLGNVATRFHRKIGCLADLIGEMKAGRYEPATLDRSFALNSPTEQAMGYSVPSALQVNEAT